MGRHVREESSGAVAPQLREWNRKLIHLATAVVPIGALILPRPLMVALLAAAVVVALGVEVARSRFTRANEIFLRFTWPMLRPHEYGGLAGATYLAIAYFIAYLTFPLPVAAAAMLFAALGDAVAALAGGRWGRHRTRWGKSWEGFAAAACVNVVVGSAVPALGLAAAAAGGLAAATLEFLPIPIDDNLRITIAGGAVTWGVWLLVGGAGAS